MGTKRICAFCGSRDLSAEHVLPDWLTRVGLSQAAVVYEVGPPNRRPHRWSGPPFKLTTKRVCRRCNTGWMADLENAAKPLLVRMIQEEALRLEVDDQEVIAAWAHKTALTAMLASSSSARAATEGLPAEEYHSFADRGDRLVPLPHSRFWVARHIGQRRMGSIWVTPLAIEMDATPSALTGPVAYSVTIALADLLIHGVRFTSPLLALD